MRVRVARVPRPNVEQVLDLGPGARVLDVIRAVGAAPDAVVVLRGDQPVPVDAPVSDGEGFRVVNVFSGG